MAIHERSCGVVVLVSGVATPTMRGGANMACIECGIVYASIMSPVGGRTLGQSCRSICGILMWELV